METAGGMIGASVRLVPELVSAGRVSDEGVQGVSLPWKAEHNGNESVPLDDLGDETMTGRGLVVVASVTPEVVPDLWHLMSVLDQVAGFCRAGALLNLAPTEEVRVYRRWWASEIERQVRVPLPAERHS